MKKISYCLALILVIILASACGNKRVQPTFVPVATNPPATPTQAAPTATSTPTPTPRYITPVPTQAVADGSDFLEILRLLSPGTQVDIEGADATAVERCFYVEELNFNEKRVMGNNGFLETEIEALQKLRVLYVGADGKIYVGEMYANRALVADLLDIFKAAYTNKTTFVSFSSKELSKSSLIEGFQVKGLEGTNREYLYLFK